MVGDLHVVASRHRETAALKLIMVYNERFRTRADVDDLWQSVQPGPFSEKQTQWLALQLCLITFGVIEWIECSQFDHLL